MSESMNHTDTMEALNARAHWYQLLAGVFAEEVQAPFLRELRSQACIEALAEVGVSFGEDFLATDEETLLEDLAARRQDPYSVVEELLAVK